MGLFSFLFQKPNNTIQINPLYKVTNMWPSNDFGNFWLYRFLQHHQLHQNSIHLFSVFGKKPLLNKADINIFFTGENVHYKTFKKYSNNAIDIADVAIGFDEIEALNYVRFPLWITYLFPPDASFETIQSIVQQYNFSENVIIRPTQFAMIASHDKRAGKRKKMVQFIEQNIGSVACAGKLLNNTDALKTKFNDHKISFLKTVAFNICPENSNYSGYVTEKIFEAIQAGCIPIYWGSNNLPEPKILNPNAIAFYNATGKNDDLINQIQLFINQKNIEHIPRFTDNAAECIWEMYEQLRLVITKAIAQKRLS